MEETGSDVNTTSLGWQYWIDAPMERVLEADESAEEPTWGALVLRPPDGQPDVLVPLGPQHGPQQEPLDLLRHIYDVVSDGKDATDVFGYAYGYMLTEGKLI